MQRATDVGTITVPVPDQETWGQETWGQSPFSGDGELKASKIVESRSGVSPWTSFPAEDSRTYVGLLGSPAVPGFF